MKQHLPLVSCIMPTADRRRFVPQAIRNFLAQDYAERELVILDDGADSIADLGTRRRTHSLHSSSPEAERLAPSAMNVSRPAAAS